MRGHIMSTYVKMRKEELENLLFLILWFEKDWSVQVYVCMLDEVVYLAEIR